MYTDESKVMMRRAKELLDTPLKYDDWARNNNADISALALAIAIIAATAPYSDERAHAFKGIAQKLFDLGFQAGVKHQRRVGDLEAIYCNPATAGI